MALSSSAGCDFVPTRKGNPWLGGGAQDTEVNGSGQVSRNQGAIIRDRMAAAKIPNGRLRLREPQATHSTTGHVVVPLP
jgi:hypothetical protein